MDELIRTRKQRDAAQRAIVTAQRLVNMLSHYSTGTSVLAEEDTREALMRFNEAVDAAKVQ